MKNIFVLVMTIFLLLSCSNQSSNIGKIEIKTEDKKVIYTSFYPLYFLTKSLVGEQVQVINLVPPGGEPHEYEPTLKQMGEIQKSDGIILNGLGMERYEEKLIHNMSSGKIILLSESLPNLIHIGEEEHGEEEHKKEEHGHHHGDIDPHTWLSPKMYLQMAHLLKIELEKKGFKNLDTTIIEQLTNLESLYSVGLAQCERKKIITSHEAFSYLARDYGFEQKAVFGISPEQEPSTKDIVGFIDLIKKEKISYIFSETFVSPKFHETIQNETQVQVLLLHTLENLSDSEGMNGENYISLMKKNLELLQRGLECKK